MGHTSSLRKILFLIAFLASLTAAVLCVIEERKEIPVYSVTNGACDINRSESEPQYEGQKLNINTASCEQLLALPGIEPELAERIIEYRLTYGLFHDVGELREIEGMGDKHFERILPYITT